MSEDARWLDGNALGGLLQELFGAELTAAPHTCQSSAPTGLSPDTGSISAPERSSAARSAGTSPWWRQPSATAT